MARQCTTKFQAHHVEPGIEYLGKRGQATETGYRIFHAVGAKAPTSGDWKTFVSADKDDAISQAREWLTTLATE